MNWILVALLAPFLWAITTFIDKALISRYFKGKTGALIIYSCLIALPVFILIFLFKPNVIHLNIGTAFFVMINGILIILYLFPYFHALNKADTSSVIPLFQMIPIFTYLLSFLILGETLTLLQIFGGLLIITGAVAISSDFKGKKFKIKKEILFSMILACLLIAVNEVMFKFFAIQLDFWTASFWQYLGFFIFGVLLLIFVKKYREDFILSYQENNISMVGINLVNETINIIASVIFGFALLLAPVALVGLTNGFQPLFVLAIGVIATLTIPKWIKEDISKKILIKKAIFIVIMIVGASLL